MITLVHRKSDDNKRIIQLINLFCALLRYNRIIGPALSDYNMRLIILSVIQLSGRHCSFKVGETKWQIFGRILYASNFLLGVQSMVKSNPGLFCNDWRKTSYVAYSHIINIDT
jgi:hypothetical protein